MAVNDSFNVRLLSTHYESVASINARLAQLYAALELPASTIHVLSDIHGEHKKLRHIVNNGSGSLRQLVEEVLGESLNEAEQNRLLHFIHYPLEMYSALEATNQCNEALVVAILQLQFALLRQLAARYTISSIEENIPREYVDLFREILFAPQLARSDEYVRTLFSRSSEDDGGLTLLRVTARVIRNSLISELVVAGDLGDRGERIDKVISYLMRQPKVSITWGNHDAIWMAACLGHTASIAAVLRISLRYSRLAQLEEGYGISLAPLEKLARELYVEDTAEFFSCRGGEGLRDETLLRRMQKAVAIIQFKLEGQLTQRNPAFALDNRNLLHCIDPNSQTVLLDGASYPLQDTHFPSVDWSKPYELHPLEQRCIESFRQSFLQSGPLWEQMSFIYRRGSMYIVRRDHLIFHACVPVDEQGEFVALEVDGELRAGKSLFDALSGCIARAFRKKQERDLDLLWYLWTGPNSPWFGKDKMATFEGYFIAEKSLQREKKNPYFSLIHEREFCQKILNEFAVPATGMIVNGHVPVKIDEGESPVKRSGLAVTIDGAFSEAYGDKGYTLILNQHGSFLAQHHHFESIEQSLTTGADIVPEIRPLRELAQPISARETEQGEAVCAEINALEALRELYVTNAIPR